MSQLPATGALFPYQHIIWDWNGTLFDDAWLCIEIMNGMLVRRNLPRITPEQYEQIFDFPVIDYYRRAGFDFVEESFERLSDEFIGSYTARLGECTLRDGTREVLALGRRKNIQQYILSAMKQEMLNEMIARFDLRHFFDDVIGLIDHHAFGKIDIGLEWLEQRKLDRATVVMVGDTTHDFEVAQALEIAFFPIHSGHHSRARLAACGVPLIDTLLELYPASVEE